MISLRRTRIAGAVLTCVATISTFCVPAFAQSSDPSCFTEAELQDILLIVAPTALTIMGEQCAVVLPRGLVLGNPQSTLFKALDIAGREAWPRAYPAIIRVMKSHGEKLAPGDTELTYEKLTPILRPIVGQIIKSPESCGPADKILKLSEPLPPRNIAGMLVQVAHLDPKLKKMNLVCPLGLTH